MAATKITDRDGRTVGKWLPRPDGRRVRLWVVRCPHAGCRYEASSCRDQGPALEAVVDHLQYAHGEAARV